MKGFFKIAVFSLVTGLSACAGFEMPGFGGPQQPVYQPLSSSLATMAAPRPSGPLEEVTCKIGKGQAKFGKGWQDFSTVSFRMVDGDRTNVTLMPLRGSGSAEIQAIFDHEGQKLVFCPLVDAAPGQQIPCASIYTLDDDLDMGIKRTFDVPDAVASGTITCAHSVSRLVGM